VCISEALIRLVTPSDLEPKYRRVKFPTFVVYPFTGWFHLNYSVVTALQQRPVHRNGDIESQVYLLTVIMSRRCLYIVTLLTYLSCILLVDYEQLRLWETTTTTIRLRCKLDRVFHLMHTADGDIEINSEKRDWFAQHTTYYKSSWSAIKNTSMW